MKKSKISQALNEVKGDSSNFSIEENNTSLVPVKVDLHPNVRAALIHPERYLEVKGWLKTHKQIALDWRGDDGESMMHWAFLSNWSLAMELKDIGLTFEDRDNFNRFPMDWLNDRLWSAIVDPNTNHRLSMGGKERLKKQTEDQVIALWSLGARPSNNAQSIHPGVVWIRAGAWPLIDLLIEGDDNYDGWMKWTPKNGHALHAWILSPNTPARRDFLKRWKDASLSLDVRDEDGRTPLWYAVEAYISTPNWRHHLTSVIEELSSSGADPDADDIDGVTPTGLILREDEQISEDNKKILKILHPDKLIEDFIV